MKNKKKIKMSNKNILNLNSFENIKNNYISLNSIEKFLENIIENNLNNEKNKITEKIERENENIKNKKEFEEYSQLLIQQIIEYRQGLNYFILFDLLVWFVSLVWFDLLV